MGRTRYYPVQMMPLHCSLPSRQCTLYTFDPKKYTNVAPSLTHTHTHTQSNAKIKRMKRNLEENKKKKCNLKNQGDPREPETYSTSRSHTRTHSISLFRIEFFYSSWIYRNMHTADTTLAAVCAVRILKKQNHIYIIIISWNKKNNCTKKSKKKRKTAKTKYILRVDCRCTEFIVYSNRNLRNKKQKKKTEHSQRSGQSTRK